jgi:hypothetical protein
LENVKFLVWIKVFTPRCYLIYLFYHNMYRWLFISMTTTNFILCDLIILINCFWWRWLYYHVATWSKQNWLRFQIFEKKKIKKWGTEVAYCYCWRWERRVRIFCYWLETLVDAATRRIGDHRPLADYFFFLSSSAETRKKGPYCLKYASKFFFGHNNRLFTDVLDPPLVGEEGQNLLL